MEICLPEWLVAVLILATGARGVLRDLVEHDGIRGVVRGSESKQDTNPSEKN
jgi:hypothetical protein